MDGQECYVPIPSSSPSTSTSFHGDPQESASLSSSSSLPPSSSLQVQEEDHQTHQEQDQQRQTRVTYRVNISISDVASTQMRDDAWSCLIVLVTFWFFAASMTLILGFYGSVNLQLGPNYSRLLQANSIFVQDIKVQELGEPKLGPILYGFTKKPPLDVEMTWFEIHNASIPANSHKEWIYFLNEGSQLDIVYSVKSQSSSPLSLIIAKGKESLVEWIEEPSYPNTTLSWNIIYGKGMIKQKIFKSYDYYIAVGNLNSEEVEVHLNITIRALVYNTTEAYYKCSLSRSLCSLKLFLFRANVAVLTSPGAEQDTDTDDLYVKLLYGPRWVTYFVGSGGMTLIILVALKVCNHFQSTTGDGTGLQTVQVDSERAPLLTNKDDDLLSWGSSYDSVSHDEDDLEEWIGVGSSGENNNNPRRLCAICFDAPRDCFFLPCGHCAACFTCGTRIAEEVGTCPICRRRMKKVRKIFTV
ncbi:PREDICTED: uncharacterized protein LOC104601271 [Nelumbo nucifera]|uniref:Uncharacterized protein LOC104601271 n=2 Tax=Nelumbo nucifera TaxID=4432 RepID=A0A1U8A8C0_NELNU|nr:PREDICTED: uncharacterized protein LOC104601271 [Nelumbo nucifera]DAD28496.1 TPA_asm: hypothetical protein HUJ06_029964 [Nelumbo nucifera]